MREGGRDRPLDLGQPRLDLVEEVTRLLDQPFGRHRVLDDHRLGELAQQRVLALGQLASGVDDHRDAQVRGMLLDPLDQGEPVHVGQAEIDDDAVELRLVERAQRLGSGRDGGDRHLAGLDQARHRRELGDVVLDDQDVACRGAGEAEQVVEGLGQRVLAGRFAQVRERAGVERLLPLLLTGDHVDGDRLRPGLALELVEQRPAVDVGQPDVERDRIGDELPRQRQSLGAGPRDQALEAAIAGQAEQNAREGRVVLDDQSDAVVRAHVLAIVFEGSGRGHDRRAGRRRRQLDAQRWSDELAHRRARRPLERLEEGEGRTPAGLRLDRHVAAEQPGDLARDRQAQARTTVLAGRRHVGLLERFEDHVVLVGRDPDPGVADGEGDEGGDVPLDGPLDPLQQQLDRAVRGELERVREQVFEDLHQPRLIGLDRVGDVGTDLDREAQPALLRDAAEGALDVVADVGDALFGDVDRRRPRLDLREVEDVVDQGEQIGAGPPDRLRHVDLPAGQIGFLVVAELLGEDQQRVERRAQLVRHVGQELGLVL